MAQRPDLEAGLAGPPLKPAKLDEEAAIAAFLANRDCRVPAVGSDELLRLVSERPLVMDARTRRLTRRSDAVPMTKTYGHGR